MKVVHRKCRSCGAKRPVQEMLINGLRAVCGDSLECQQSEAIKLINKAREAKDREYKRETKRIKEKYKGGSTSIRELTEYIQRRIFNVYIKLRDKGKPCISCGKHEHEIKNFRGWHAGHYLSVGARKDLRFNEDNCHAQCSGCNLGENHNKAKEATTAQRYRANLIDRIGEDKVLVLESYNVHKYTYDELIGIKEYFNKKLKKLKSMGNES